VTDPRWVCRPRISRAVLKNQAQGREELEPGEGERARLGDRSGWVCRPRISRAVLKKPGL